LTTNPDVLWAAKDEPLSLTAELSAAVVRYVSRSRQPVIIGEAQLPTEFADDPYLREHRPKSLLCLPLVHHDRLLGVWYAESETASDLRQGTIELLQLLAGQAGSALANARLYEQLKEASLELSDKNDRLERELVERERIERERAALRERVIAMQDELLLELSTPLIPISERVIVIPIVGTIGEKRTNHMVETILAGVHERRARAVIIDVTGMRQVDDATMHVLLKTASALRLLGVLVVLTGVRPDAARAVVDMGVDMSGITIRSTLQAGIAFAISQAGLVAKAS
jgi:anti-anti-sigma regulatory factor